MIGDVASATSFATSSVQRVRDDPAGRRELMSTTYDGVVRNGRRHTPYRAAALSFMDWQLGRGLLAPLDASRPGSVWWRSVNEQLLRDGCEAASLAEGRAGEPSSQQVQFWTEFLARPSAAGWYRAHNASIVAGFLESRELADEESESERFFMNVALLRVLYAHALVGNPRLALGRFRMLGPVLGDPRLGMAGAFLSLGRVLPDRYPLGDLLSEYLQGEHGLGRLIDYAIIAPKLQALYEWSAGAISEPRLTAMVRDGAPVYAWPYERRDVWVGRESRLERLLTAATRA
jgi:hypothetical protein